MVDVVEVERVWKWEREVFDDFSNDAHHYPDQGLGSSLKLNVRPGFSSPTLTNFRKICF